MSIAAKRQRSAHGARGQSLTELALLLPVLLLLTLISIDFGRVYLGWINLQNMARVAANYAANNPTAWSGAGDAAIKASYQSQILADAQANNCTLPTSGGTQIAPDPTFPGGTNLGGTANVGLSCTFRLITPIISKVVGNNGALTVSAAAVFPIKNGIAVGATGGSGGGGTGPTAAISANPQGGFVPLSVTFTDASTGAPVSWLWNFGDGSATSTLQNPTPAHVYGIAGNYTVTLTVTNSSGLSDTTTQVIAATNPPPATCQVPDFIGDSSTTVQGEWNTAGFTTTVSFKQGGLPWTVKSQSLVALSNQPCNTGIQVSKT